MNLGWDKQIGEEFRVRGEKWKCQSSSLEYFSMDLCVKPVGFG